MTDYSRLPRVRAMGVLLLGAFMMVGSVAARGQPTSLLAEFAGKTQLNDADTQAIQQVVRSLADRLKAANNERTQKQAREALLTELKQGRNATPAFQAAIAKAAVDELAGLIRLQLDKAFDATLVLSSLNHPATCSGLFQALKSRYAAIRYKSAQALFQMHPLLTTPDLFNPVIVALADAAEIEIDALTQRMIYQALDFSDVNNFTGKNELAVALTRIFTVRLGLQATNAFNPNNHIVAYKVIFRNLGDLSQPPVPLTANLARILRVFVERTIDDRDSVRVEALQECELALQLLIEKNGGQTAGLPKIHELVRDNAPPKQLRDALIKFIGSDAESGILNKAPWNLSPGLGA